VVGSGCIDPSVLKTARFEKQIPRVERKEKRKGAKTQSRYRAEDRRERCGPIVFAP
jgi:hypothetical protein